MLHNRGEAYAFDERLPAILYRLYGRGWRGTRSGADWVEMLYSPIRDLVDQVNNSDWQPENVPGYSEAIERARRAEAKLAEIAAILERKESHPDGS